MCKYERSRSDEGREFRGKRGIGTSVAKRNRAEKTSGETLSLSQNNTAQFSECTRFHYTHPPVALWNAPLNSYSCVSSINGTFSLANVPPGPIEFRGIEAASNVFLATRRILSRNGGIYVNVTGSGGYDDKEYFHGEKKRKEVYFIRCV